MTPRILLAVGSVAALTWVACANAVSAPNDILPVVDAAAGRTALPDGASDKDAAVPVDAAPSECESTGAGKCYYIAPKPGTGSGTRVDPFGLDDLPLDTDTANCLLTSKALEVLQPGDYLYFRGGDYAIKGCSGGYWALGYIRPARSGAPGNPITIKAYQKEKVQLNYVSGSQPAMGNDAKEYVRFFGFSFNAIGIMLTVGAGVEVAYNDFLGRDIPNNTDNNESVSIDGATSAWIHHNKIHGSKGTGENNAGIKVYRGKNLIVENNYVYDNICGIFDKESGTNNTYRFNFVTQNTTEFDGNNQAIPLSASLYENVFDGPVELHYLGEGIEVHDNLFRADAMAGDWAGQVYRTKVWNNVVISQKSSVQAYRADKTPLSGAPADKSPLEYMDYNFYDAPPTYAFDIYGQPENYALSSIRGLGFEMKSDVMPGNVIYVDQTSYAVLPSQKNAGRNGDTPGPDNVAAILNLSGYGPGAAP